MEEYDVKNIRFGGRNLHLKDATARDYITLLFEQSDCVYEGRDLTAIFADEIVDFTDEWAWIKNRINLGNYTGIHVGDYIPLGKNDMQVAGIDSYTGTTDMHIGHHIDFISRDCNVGGTPWSANSSNNGSATSSYPYLISLVYSNLKYIYDVLPENVKNVISDKRCLLEQRYSASGTLKESTSWGWTNMGKLWVPTEHEVFGTAIWATKGYGQGLAVQYPLFTQAKNRIKHDADNNRCSWWLASAASGTETNACSVNPNGFAHSIDMNTSIFFPLCFRIMQ